MRALFDRLRSAEDVAHEQADGVNKDANILGAVFLRRVEDLRNAEDKGRACVTDVSERARPPPPPPPPSPLSETTRLPQVLKLDLRNPEGKGRVSRT